MALTTDPRCPDCGMPLGPNPAGGLFCALCAAAKDREIDTYNKWLEERTTMTEQRCGSCKHAKGFSENDARCGCPLPWWIDSPMVAEAYANIVQADDGTDCDCWDERKGEDANQEG